MSENKVTYVMPKVSTIMRDSGVLSAGMAYDYSDITIITQRRKRSLFERLIVGTFSFIGFIITMSLFVLSVSLTSYMLVNTMNSQTAMSMKTQVVPSDGIERNYYPEHITLKSIETKR